ARSLGGRPRRLGAAPAASASSCTWSLRGRPRLRTAVSSVGAAPSASLLLALGLIVSPFPQGVCRAGVRSPARVPRRRTGTPVCGASPATPVPDRPGFQEPAFEASGLPRAERRQELGRSVRSGLARRRSGVLTCYRPAASVSICAARRVVKRLRHRPGTPGHGCDGNTRSAPQAPQRTGDGASPASTGAVRILPEPPPERPEAERRVDGAVGRTRRAGLSRGGGAAAEAAAVRRAAKLGGTALRPRAPQRFSGALGRFSLRPRRTSRRDQGRRTAPGGSE